MDYPDDFPKKNKKRGKRFAAMQGVTNKAQKLAKYVYKLPEDVREHFIQRARNNLVNCNCWMCRNPRNVFHGEAATLTMQERKQLAKERTDDSGSDDIS